MTRKVRAGWQMASSWKKDMTNLIANQIESDLTEAEAIAQAREGVAAAFEYLYKAHCRRVYSLC